MTLPGDVRSIATIWRRARGVWLVHVIEWEDGTEEWNAFSTLRNAKRWATRWCDEPVLNWARPKDSPNVWQAEVLEA